MGPKEGAHTARERELDRRCEQGVRELAGAGQAVLTEEVGEPLGLVVVDDGNTQRVEGYQTEHSPVEGLSFDHAADVETHPPLLFVKKGRVLQLGTFNAGSGKGRPCQGKGGECQGVPVEESNQCTAQARTVARATINLSNKPSGPREPS